MRRAPCRARLDSNSLAIGPRRSAAVAATPMLLKLSTNTSITTANSAKSDGCPALYSTAASTPAGTKTKSDRT